MLFRATLIALTGALALTGCADPEMAAKVEALEQKIAELEAGRGGAAGPGAERENQAREGIAKVNQHVSKMEFAEAAKVCESLAKDFGDTQTYRRGGRVCNEVSVVGKDAMDLDVERWLGAGTSVNLGDAPTLLVFWEEWCPHCRREVPKLEEMHKQYAGRMQVVGLTKINRSSTLDSVEKFLAENNVTYPVAKEKDGNLSSYYGVSGVPAAAFVKDGKVVWRGHPARLDDAALKQLL